MGRQQGVYYDAKLGQWRVDKVVRGRRIQGRHHSHQEAQRWLLGKLAEVESHLPIVNRSMTLSQAATRYLVEQERIGKVSLPTETYMLEPVVAMLGHLALDQLHDGTLQQFVDKRLAEGKSHKTINLSLGVVRRILNLAARKWRVDLGDGRTAPVLAQAPLLTMLPLTGYQREPRPISWEEQRGLLPLLPPHLARMTLFMLNTGIRDNVIVSLRWQWELKVKIDDEIVSVFEVPRLYVKGRKSVAYIVCNSVAQRVLESVRCHHPEFVFVWRQERVKNLDMDPAMPYSPVTTMSNSAWHNARKKAGLADLHVHDLRHTVGMRLREAGVSESTTADVLWHRRPGMTAHYSAAQVRELRDALELIRDDSGRANVSLRMLSLQAKAQRVSNGGHETMPMPKSKAPSQSLQQRKMV
jgi:integrase